MLRRWHHRLRDVGAKMTATVLPFPISAMSRVDRLCRAVADECKGPHELIRIAVDSEQVRVTIVDLELYLKPDEVRELATRLVASADKAEVAR